MLPAPFNERLKEVMAIKIEEHAREATEEFSRASADAAQKGRLGRAATPALHHHVAKHHLEKRISAIVEAQRTVASALAVPFSDTLAADLKAQIESYAPETWCKQLVDRYEGLDDDRQRAQFDRDLLATRRIQLRKAFLDVDLMIDRLQSQVPTPTSEPKEREQNFKILWSRGQAKRDFEAWKADAPQQQPIGVVFLDIDHFKRFNSQYTETLVDQTLLPAVQMLLRDLVVGHGEPYRTGGDEFLVLLRNHEAPECEAFLERVRRTFESYPFDVQGKVERLTVSLGFAIYPDHGSAYEDVLRLANEAKRVAKQTRNTVTMATLSLSSDSPLRALGLRPLAQRLALLLNQRSKAAEYWDPALSAAEVLGELGVSPQEVGEAADELSERGWVRLNKTMGMGDAYFSDIGAHPELFIETDPYIVGSDPRKDARTLAKKVVETATDSTSGISIVDLDKGLNWGPRRMNPAAYVLANGGYVTAIEGGSPYAYRAVFVTPATRRFAKD
jgi:diguanylate cyclase (GGDEF)-like protein